MKNITLTEDQKAVVSAMLADIVSECNRVDREQSFNDMLDECYSFEKVGGPFANMSPSRVLLECDPIAHRCGVNDYAGGMEWTEIDGDSYETRDVEEAQEAFIDALRCELLGLETERDDTPEDETADISDISQQIHAKEAAIEACENYQF